MVPGTEPASRFVAAVQSGRVDEARRIAIEEVPPYELEHFIVEPLAARLESLPRRFMAGQEASRKLARMLLKELVDQMFAGDVATGGHRGPNGRWYVYKGLSPDLVEVSGDVIEKVDKVRFLRWLGPLESLLADHLSGRIDRDTLYAELRNPALVEAATYPHRALHRAALQTDGDPGGGGDLDARAARDGVWDPKKDPDLRVCFSGEHGYIVLGGGQSHLIDQAYREAARVVRRMSQQELLDVARRMLGEMLQPDYQNFIRNVTAKVTPILGLPPQNRLEIREDMEAGGRDNMLLMLALSRARHAGWLSDAVVEDLYAMRASSHEGNGPTAVQGVDVYPEVVARLMDRPDDRSVLQSLSAGEARILMDDAIQLLRRQRMQSAIETPADRMRRGLALLKILCLHGVLDGFMIYPYAGRNFFPAQFGRLAALNEASGGRDAKDDRQSFQDEVAREEEVCRRAGAHTDRIQANLVTQRVPGLVMQAATMAVRAMNGAVREIPDRPVALLLHLRRWLQDDPASPVWAADLDLAYSRLLVPWASVLRRGDYLVLFEGDVVFRHQLLSDLAFEEVELGLAPPDMDLVAEMAPTGPQRSASRPMTEPIRAATRPLDAFELPNNAVVLRRAATAPADPS